MMYNLTYMWNLKWSNSQKQRVERSLLWGVGGVLLRVKGCKVSVVQAEYTPPAAGHL